MTFEEFFKRKKINLALLKVAEPALFAEFELHFGQMGENSFDHTKKYWFNALRRKYPAPEEPKVEKLKIENQLAEQTITEAITETVTTPAPKLGFKPKFKTAAAESATDVPEQTTGPTEDASAPKLGFKPKFKTAAAPAPVENTEPVIVEVKAELTEEATPAPKLGFKPKFKTAAIAKPIDEMPEQKAEAANREPSVKTEPEPEVKPAYKPKFKMQNFKPTSGDE